MDKKNKFIGGFSSQLMRENLKQQWYIPALLFILYFISGIFPLLLLSKDYRGTYAVTCLGNANIIYGMFITWMPLIVACIVMAYYHYPAKSFALHAQPYSRGKLFNTQIITGWVMMIVPVIIMGIIYMAMSGGLKVEEIIEGAPSRWVQAYTVTDVFKWMGESICYYTFYYGITVLAGSIVGNTVTHILGTLVFYNLVPALAGITLMYCELCLNGYDEPSTGFMKLIMNSEPLAAGTFRTLFSVSEDYVQTMGAVWYLVIGIALIILAKYACYRAKLEKVGDSMIFRPVEAVITVIITFIGGSLMAMLFGALFDFGSKVIFLLGALIGAAISFFLVKLILSRTVRIFNKGNLKTFIISLVILLIFLLVFITDLTGFSSKVPAEADIATVDARGVGDNFVTMNGYSVSDDESKYFPQEVQTDDSGFIKKTAALHKYIVDNKLYEIKSGEEINTATAEFSYVLKNGKTFKRRFTFKADDTCKEMINDLLRENGIKELVMIPESLKQTMTTAYIEVYMNTDGTENYAFGNIPKKGRADILAVIDSYNRETSDDIISYEFTDADPDMIEDSWLGGAYPEEPNQDYGCINIYYESDKEAPYEGYTPSVRIGLGNGYAETLELIRELCDKYPAE